METASAAPIYWSRFSHADWNLHIAATDQGLCYVGGHNQPFAELAAWSDHRMQGRPLIRDDRKLEPYAAELCEYFQGTRRRFTVPLDPRGTPFQTAVWQALCTIPFGQTRSYSDIARQIAKPSAVRAVGAAIGANPLMIAVPCHRVIGKNGSLTGYRGGLEMKKRLLHLEQYSSSC
jgi:methylated-DNA-[protein]-cysteine S-methyltransferase